MLTSDFFNSHATLFCSLMRLFHNLLLQNIVSVTIVSTLSLSGAIPTEPLTWNLIKIWFPVNIIFVAMLITSMFRYVANLQHQFGLSTVCCAVFLGLNIRFVNGGHGDVKFPLEFKQPFVFYVTKFIFFSIMDMNTSNVFLPYILRSTDHIIVNGGCENHY